MYELTTLFTHWHPSQVEVLTGGMTRRATRTRRFQRRGAIGAPERSNTERRGERRLERNGEREAETETETKRGRAA